MATELEDEGLGEGPDENTDGYEWAIEEIRSIVNTLGNHEDPLQRPGGPKHSLRVFHLINQLVDLIPGEGTTDDETL